VDRHPLLAGQDVTAAGLVHSPRGTVLYEISPAQVFRLTVGSAFRAPTFLESYIDLFAPIPSQPAIGVRFQGSQTLRPEQMVQAEVGFRGHVGSFRPDVVVYAERVQNLITDGALRLPANPAEAVEPKSGQYVAGYAQYPGNNVNRDGAVSAKLGPLATHVKNPSGLTVPRTPLKVPPAVCRARPESCNPHGHNTLGRG